MRHDCNSISATTTTTTTRRAAMRLHRSQGAASASDSAVATGSSTAPCGSSPSAAGLWSPCRRSASWFRCYRPTTPPCGSAERRTTTPMASTTPRPRVRTMWWSRRPPPGGGPKVCSRCPLRPRPVPCRNRSSTRAAARRPHRRRPIGRSAIVGLPPSPASCLTPACSSARLQRTWTDGATRCAVAGGGHREVTCHKAIHLCNKRGTRPTEHSVAVSAAQ